MRKSNLMTAKFRPRTARAHGDSKAGRGKIRASNRWFPKRQPAPSEPQQTSGSELRTPAAKPRFQSASQKEEAAGQFPQENFKNRKGELPRREGRTKNARVEVQNRETRLRTACALTALKPSKTFTILRFRPRFSADGSASSMAAPTAVRRQAEETQKKAATKAASLAENSGSA